LEQHPDRARLFMQWHEMGWPVLWDPFNILEYPVVPVTYLLDAAGRVLLIQPLLERIDEIQRRILDHPAGPADEPEPDDLATVISPEITSTPAADAGPITWSDHAVSLAIWGGADRLDEAVAAARRAEERSVDPVVWFRLGVVLRMRYDSADRQSGDFAAAVAAWTRALDTDPNQYIWRRRLQQYGPRLAKPYPFYDWVPKARHDIESRGGQPTELVVEPHGAEFAEPATEVTSGAQVEPVAEPDPDARVQADRKGLVDVETVLIPPVPRPGEAVRVHLILTPNHTLDAHWNNEAGYSELWVNPPQGWPLDQNHQLLPVGPGDVSDESRHLEFEVKVPESPDTDDTLTGYLLYYACEGATGVCVYRRQDLHIPIPIGIDQETAGLAG